ncbi:MAG TPA: chitobiase/beta-hexosaminidase C-terminal domain-containing protein, partial [Verrucomicrobiae bacterium]|nr:chitobiase/beta-hexosaminidase C-terminal domain-containing protein [Verrucomicrobiae bacterium]
MKYLPILLGLCLTSASAQTVSVLTYHYDNARTGQNTNEIVLTPANVNTNTFGVLFTYPVDGQIYAEPLIMTNVVIPGQGAHNVVIVATQHDSVYAFDADSNAGPNGGLLWHSSMGTSAATPNNFFGSRYGPYHDIDPEVGITSTPVIDPVSGTIYVDAFTDEGSSFVHRIHALDITTGAERTNSPVVVTASLPGIGVGSSGGILSFNPLQHLQRPALTLAGGMLYVAYSGYADTDPYHGWVIGFNTATLKQVTNYVFNTTPNATTAAFGGNAGEGGIWQSGNGLSVDAGNNLYFEVGNGSFNGTNGLTGTEYGDSFIKLSTTNGLKLVDFFAPFNQASLAAADIDLGSGGPMLMPDSVGNAAHPHLIVGCGKEGKIYLLDRDNLGHFSNSTNDNQIVQELPGAVGGTWSSGAYFNRMIYYQGSGDVLKNFAFASTNGALLTTPVSQSSTSFGYPGATPVISANGTNNAIAWVIQSDGYVAGGPSGPSILHAYNAYNLAQELYNSSQAGNRDNPGEAVKFTLPTVANGKVYVGAQYSLAVFGNGAFIAAPVINPKAGLFTNSVTVTITETTPGAVVRYTLDNSAPTTNSPVYTSSFTLTNTAAVKARAFKTGTIPSGITSVAFINSASLVLAPGFVKEEFYSGALRTDLENPAFSTPPTFVHYLASFETPSGQGVNYAERVSGYFTAPVTTNYVFFVCSDDDSDLFLSTDNTPANKHLIAQETAWSNNREWTNSSGNSTLTSKRSDQFTGTTWPTANTISLTAGITYYIEADHHQAGGGDDFAATFKFAGAPDPANGSAPKLIGNLVAAYAYNNAYISVTSLPQNAVAVQGGTATFTISASTGYLGDTTGAAGPPILYQWQSAPVGSGTFTNIPNATGASYTTPPLSQSQSGEQFRVSMTTAGLALTSSVATLTMVSDTAPPQPVQIISVNNALTVVTVAFSKPLDSVSAQRAQNYAFSPGNIAVTNASLDTSGTNVLLTAASALSQNTLITLAITGVKDLAGISVPTNTTITFSCALSGPTAFAPTILSDGPLAYWRLSEAGGGTAIDSVGGHNGTYGSAAIPGVPGPRPPAFLGLESTNVAAQFQAGVDQSWVTVPALNLNTNTVTFAAWVYPIGNQQGYAGLLMTRNGSTQGGWGYTTSDQIGYTWNGNSSATYNFQSGLVPPQNEWSFIALVIDPAKAVLYLYNT